MHTMRAIGLGFALIAGAAGAAGQEPASPPLSPLVVESLAPLLASWIKTSRDDAKAQGVEPIPPAIREALTGYVPDLILDRVRWREGASELSMPQNVLRIGDVPAVTLDDVVVFKSRQEALEDPKLWAHELKHVMQYAAWGIDGFAARYVGDYWAVEEEAWEYRWEFMKQAGLVPGAPSPGP